MERNDTSCRHGHELTGENVYLNPRGVVECRACRRGAAAKYRNSDTGILSEQATRNLLEGLRAGKTINNLLFGRVGRKGRIPGERTVTTPYKRYKNTIRLKPKLGRIITKLAAENANVARKSGAASRRLLAAPAIMRKDGADAFDAIRSATCHLFEPLRGAVQSDIWLDVSEGRLSIKSIPSRVQDYVRKYNRDEKHSVMSRWGNRSLDAPVGDSGFSLLDTTPDLGGWSPVAANTGRHVSTRNWK